MHGNNKLIWEAPDGAIGDVEGRFPSGINVVFGSEEAGKDNRTELVNNLVGGRYPDPSQQRNTLPEFYGGRLGGGGLSGVSFDTAQYYSGRDRQEFPALIFGDIRYEWRTGTRRVRKRRERGQPIEFEDQEYRYRARIEENVRRNRYHEHSPNYNYRCSAFFDDFGMGFTESPPDLSFTMRRLELNALGLGAVNEYEDNYAEVIWDILTNKVYGKGMPEALLDRESFIRVGRTLASEGFGVACMINRVTTPGDIIQLLLNNVQGEMYRDQVTGRLGLNLLRDDFDLTTMTQGHDNRPIISLDENDIIEVRRFNKNPSDDGFNEVRVSFMDREKEYEENVVKVTDFASRYLGADKRIDTISAFGVTGIEQATHIANLTLEQHRSELLSAQLVVRGDVAMDITPRDVIVWSNRELGVERAVMRILKIDYGNPHDSRVIIDCLESRFTLEHTIINTPRAGTEFEIPEVDFENLADWKVEELPRFINYKILQELPETEDGASADSTRLHYFGICPDSNARGFRTEVASRGFGEYTTDLVNGVCSNTGSLDTATTHEFGGQGSSKTMIPKTGLIDSITIDNINFPDFDVNHPFFDKGVFEAGDRLLQIGNEIMAYRESFVSDDGEKIVFRGIDRAALDTVPEEHANGTRVWLYTPLRELSTKWGAMEFAGDEQLTVRFTSINALGESRRITREIDLNARPLRPNPPKQIRLGINGEEDPDTVQELNAGARQLNVLFKMRKRDFEVNRLGGQNVRFKRNEEESEIVERGTQLLAEFTIDGVAYPRQGMFIETNESGTPTSRGTMILPAYGNVHIEFFTEFGGRESLYRVERDFMFEEKK